MFSAMARLQDKGMFWSLPKRAPWLCFLQLVFHTLFPPFSLVPSGGQPGTYQASLLAPEWTQPMGDTENRTEDARTLRTAYLPSGPLERSCKLYSKYHFLSGDPLQSKPQALPQLVPGGLGVTITSSRPKSWDTALPFLGFPQSSTPLSSSLYSTLLK